MYSIRAANSDDFRAINVLSQHLGYRKISDDECRLKLTQLLSSQTDVVYVAQSKDTVIAWVHLFMARRLASPDFHEIGGLVVNPSYRGQGVGKALLESVAKQHGGTLRVRCNEKRLESHLFYKALGFKSTKLQRIFEIHS